MRTLLGSIRPVVWARSKAWIVDQVSKFRQKYQCFRKGKNKARTELAIEA